MRRVLIVAYYFPPIGGIGSIRLARFAELLPEFGWDPVVLAPRETPHASDPHLRFSEEQVVRSHSIEISRLGRMLPGTRAATPSAAQAKRGVPRRRITRNAVRRAGLRLIFPDAQIGWYPGAVFAGLRRMRQGTFDAVYSSAFPMTGHLIGRTLSRRRRLPWVAEYRDPWSALLPPGSPHRHRAEALERAIAKDAAALVMPSPTWATHFGDLWGRDIAVIPNGFDLVNRPHPIAPARPTITYLGTYYPGRQSLVPLWESVARMRRDATSELPRIRVIGELPPAGRAELQTSGIADLLEETGLVSHERAMRLLSSSTLLVASGEQHGGVLGRGTIAAKLFEYLGTPRPILYLGNPADDAARMLSAHAGCRVARHSDARAIDAALEDGLAGRSYDREVVDLTRQRGARELASVLSNVARPSSRK